MRPADSAASAASKPPNSECDSQPRVALNLGYTQEALLDRVERFMQDYYRCAQTIYQTSKVVESRLALTIGRTSSGAKVPIREALKIAAGFRGEEAFQAGVSEQQALDTVLPRLSRERATELATECIQLYIWDRLGCDN